MTIFGPPLGTDGVDAALTGRAWVRTLCDVEAALARAQHTVGLLDANAADAVVAAAARAAEEIDPDRLAAASIAGGNPVIPLVPELRLRAGAHSDAVHRGATSQDVLDTAMMIVTGRCLAVIDADLTATGDLLADLAARTRDEVMIGRTLLQQARLTTFGALAAGWGTGLDRAADGLRAQRTALPAQLGGPVGTLADWYPHGLRLVSAFAAEVGLAEPAGVWHADRTVITTLAGCLGTAAGATAKIATDLVLLAQTELGEVREAAPGGSSSMPHKQNPVAAVTARAAAMQAPGLVATLLTAAAPELQRGAGPWHAEWPALTSLLRAVGGSAARLRTAVSGLHVDVTRLQANAADGTDGVDLDATAGTAAGTGHAADLVEKYLLARSERASR